MRSTLKTGIRHLSSFTVAEYLNLLSKNIFTVTEKIDGTHLCVGYDTDYRFFSYREQDGKKYYGVNDWSCNFSTNEMRCAHSILQKILYKHRYKIGNDTIPVELMFGLAKNTIGHNGNIIYFLPHPLNSYFKNHFNNSYVASEIIKSPYIEDFDHGSIKLKNYSKSCSIGFLKEAIINFEGLPGVYESISLFNDLIIRTDNIRNEQLKSKIFDTLYARCCAELEINYPVEGFVFSYNNDILFKLVRSSGFINENNKNWFWRRKIQGPGGDIYQLKRKLMSIIKGHRRQHSPCIKNDIARAMARAISDLLSKYKLFLSASELQNKKDFGAFGNVGVGMIYLCNEMFNINFVPGKIADTLQYRIPDIRKEIAWVDSLLLIQVRCQEIYQKKLSIL